MLCPDVWCLVQLQITLTLIVLVSIAAGVLGALAWEDWRVRRRGEED